MRFGVLLAAIAALWVQPSAAATIENFVVDFDNLTSIPGVDIRHGGTSIVSGGPSGNYLKVLPYDGLNTIRLDGAYGETSFPDGSKIQSILTVNSFDLFFENDGYMVNLDSGRIAVMGGSWFTVFTNTDRGALLFRSAGGVRLDNIAVTRFTQAIPEPSTWALMILGFGLIGVALRRHQLRVQLPPEPLLVPVARLAP